MESTTSPKFNQPSEDGLSQSDKEEFRECNFPKFKSINNEKGAYLCYGTNEVKKVQAGTAYEAVHKANLKNIKKIVYMGNIVGIKNIFAPHELVEDQDKAS